MRLLDWRQAWLLYTLAGLVPRSTHADEEPLICSHYNCELITATNGKHQRTMIQTCRKKHNSTNCTDGECTMDEKECIQVPIDDYVKRAIEEAKKDEIEEDDVDADEVIGERERIAEEEEEVENYKEGVSEDNDNHNEHDEGGNDIHANKESCVDDHENCEYWMTIGECEVDPSYMLVNCKKSCNVCENYNEEDDDIHANKEPCVDDHENCEYWMTIGECEVDPAYMLVNCKKSCNVCDKYDDIEEDDDIHANKEPCVDDHEDCEYWMTIGECEVDLAYMLVNCKKSCNVCDNYDDSEEDQVTDFESDEEEEEEVGNDEEGPFQDTDDHESDLMDEDFDNDEEDEKGEVEDDNEWHSQEIDGGEDVKALCVDIDEDCEYWSRRGECEENPRYMRENCRRSCKLCEPEHCVDADPQCPTWTLWGECQGNPDYMLANCKRSCNVCGNQAGIKTQAKDSRHRDDLEDNEFWAQFLDKDQDVEDDDDSKKDEGYDETLDDEACVDDHEYCEFWMGHNECEENPAYMLVTCKKSCNVCGNHEGIEAQAEDFESEADVFLEESSSKDTAEDKDEEQGHDEFVDEDQDVNGDEDFLEEPSPQDTEDVEEKDDDEPVDKVHDVEDNDDRLERQTVQDTHENDDEHDVEDDTGSKRDDGILDGESCVDVHEHCEEWQAIGECEGNPAFMLKACKRSCNVCGLNQVEIEKLILEFDYEEDDDYDGPCEDLDEDCVIMAYEDGECQKNPRYMRENCRRSCKFCEPENCADVDPQCPTWALYGECKKNPGYLLRNCEKSKVCSSNETITIALGVKQRTDIETLPVLSRLDDARDYLENAAIKNDPQTRQSVALGNCKLHHENCTRWAVEGKCDEFWMKQTCGPVCYSCDFVLPLEARCLIDSKTMPDAWKPGSLNEFFSNITTKEEFKKYEPKILSRPDYLPGDTNETADYQLGPWVVTLENVVSEEEAERLIELGSIEGYKRSTEVGRPMGNGYYDEKISDKRTSTNAWCQTDCARDDIAQKVFERVTEEIGNVPSLNSEFFQLLKYEEGQFYKTHHDFIAHEVNRQAGPRIMTIFLYLNQVEEGGETNFPELNNLTVAPKRGRALIWPNCMDDNPNKSDQRMKHQALNVTKGIKYGANAWIHLRDFQTPRMNGC